MRHKLFRFGDSTVDGDVDKDAASERDRLSAGFGFRLVGHSVPVSKPDGLQHEENRHLRAAFLRSRKWRFPRTLLQSGCNRCRSDQRATALAVVNGKL